MRGGSGTPSSNQQRVGKRNKTQKKIEQKLYLKIEMPLGNPIESLGRMFTKVGLNGKVTDNFNRKFLRT